MKDWAQGFYKSKAWQACRDTALRRDCFLCQDCLKAGRYTPAEIVHHVIELSQGNIYNPEITMNLGNLVSLCRECHAARHGARQRRYIVDDFGHVVIK